MPDTILFSRHFWLKALAVAGVALLAFSIAGCDDEDDADPYDVIPPTATPVLNPSPIPTPEQNIVYTVEGTPRDVVSEGLIRVRTRFSNGRNANNVFVRYENLSPNLGYLSEGLNTLPGTVERFTENGESFLLFKAIPPATAQAQVAFVRVTIGNPSSGEASIEVVEFNVQPQVSQ